MRQPIDKPALLILVYSARSGADPEHILANLISVIDLVTLKKYILRTDLSINKVIDILFRRCRTKDGYTGQRTAMERLSESGQIAYKLRVGAVYKRSSFNLMKYTAKGSMIVTFLLSFFSSLSLYAVPAMVDLVYIGEKTHPAYIGVQQGLIEANLQGQFLGKRYAVATYTTKQWKQHDLSGSIGIFSVDKDTLLALSAAYPRTSVFNLSVFDDALRQDCRYNLLHIIPSRNMLRDATLQWKKKHPDTVVVAQAWHENFKKFAARDLNKRFLKNQKKTMDDYAWAGWAAVKMVSDTVIRSGLAKPHELLSYLKTQLSFDGQKGANMNFRETGQLNQPILLIENNKIVAEAPVKEVAASSTLDDLGRLHCKK